MPRSKDGRKIAKLMDVKRIKTSDSCATCHFTLLMKPGSSRIKPVAGNSCENCHGPAKDWLKIHDDYGGKNITAKQETKAHKAKRIAASIEAGMVHPKNIYRLYRQCYQCHTIGNEKLVNRGEHPDGNKFELVAWANGEIRHRVWKDKGKTNRPIKDAQKSLMYILGQVFNLEYALHNLAKASEDGKYAQAMVKRAKMSIANLEKISNLVSVSQVNDILKIAKGTKLTLANKSEFETNANKIARLTKQFGENNDGKDLTAIKGLLPKKYKGKPKKL